MPFVFNRYEYFTHVKLIHNKKEVPNLLKEVYNLYTCTCRLRRSFGRLKNEICVL